MKKQPEPFTVQFSRTVVHEGTIQIWAHNEQEALSEASVLLDEDSPEIVWEAVEDNREIDGLMAN